MYIPIEIIVAVFLIFMLAKDIRRYVAARAARAAYAAANAATRAANAATAKGAEK